MSISIPVIHHKRIERERLGGSGGIRREDEGHSLPHQGVRDRGIGWEIDSCYLKFKNQDATPISNPLRSIICTKRCKIRWLPVCRNVIFWSLATDGGFRARRRCAEQETSGSQSQKPTWGKGVTAMVKHIFLKVNLFHLDTLAILGWFAFVYGFLLVQPMWLKLVILSVARFLPWPLHTLSPKNALLLTGAAWRVSGIREDHIIKPSYFNRQIWETNKT